VIILSDFRDWYDDAATGSGPVYNRVKALEPPPRDRWALLHHAGYDQPPGGRVRDVLGNVLDGETFDAVEAYLDDEGTRRAVWTQQDLLCVSREGMWPEYEWMRSRPCSVHLGAPHFREVHVGRLKFVVDLLDDRVVRTSNNRRDGLPYPCYAVDLAWRKGRLYALDLDVAPTLKCLQRCTSAEDVVREIETFLQRGS